MKHRSLYGMIQGVTETHAAAVAFRTKKDGQWTDMTWKQVQRLLTRVSKSLIALDVRHGDRVSILSQTRLELSLIHI